MDRSRGKRCVQLARRWLAPFVGKNSAKGEWEAQGEMRIEPTAVGLPNRRLQCSPSISPHRPSASARSCRARAMGNLISQVTGLEYIYIYTAGYDPPSRGSAAWTREYFGGNGRKVGGIKPVIRFPPKNDGDNGADNARKLSVRVIEWDGRWEMEVIRDLAILSLLYYK